MFDWMYENDPLSYIACGVMVVLFGAGIYNLITKRAK